MGGQGIRRASGVAVLSLAWLLSSPSRAAADVVHLNNGRTVSGEVVREDEREVVIKTPQGKVTLPRRMVTKIERSSAEATLLELAKERLAGGDRAEAEALLRKAAGAKDPQVASAARARLAQLEAQAEGPGAGKDEPRTRYDLPSGVTGSPTEGATLQAQLNRARRALDYRDGLRARALLEPLVTQNPEQPQLRYALGRALVLAGDPSAARAAYEAVLGRHARFLEDQPLEWLEDLARRRAAGEELGPETPGGGSRWHRSGGREVALYSLHALDARLARRLDALAAAARRSFDLRARDSDPDGRIQVCLALSGEELSDLGPGPTPRTVTIDGVLWRHRLLARDLESLGAGLISCALLERAVPGTPAWAAWGASAQLRSEEARDAELAAARTRYALDPPSLADILEGRLPGSGPSDAESTAQRGLCTLVVQLLVARRGELRKALNFTSKIERLGGAAKALERFRIDADELEGAYLAALAGG